MQLKYSTTLLFISTLFFFFSCKDKVDFFVRSQLERAIDIGEEYPQKALSILDSIQGSKGMSETNFMLYQIAKVRANRNLYNKIGQDQIKLIVRASDFFEKKKENRYAFLANYYAAIANNEQYSYRSNTEQELKHYLKAYSYAKNMNDSLSIGKTLYNIGLMYYDQQVYDSTKSYLAKATPFFDNYPSIQVQAYRLLSLSYYIDNKLDSTLLYLNEGIPLLTYKDNQKFAYLYNTLYGITYIEMGEYNKAIGCLSKNMTDSISEKEKVRTAFNLIKIYTEINNLDSATYYIKYAAPKLTKIQEKELLLFAYSALQDYYLETGDKDKSKEYLNLFRKKEDIIKQQNEAKKLFLVDREFKEEQLIKLQSEYRRISNILIVVIVAMIGVFLIILRRVRRNREKLIDLYQKNIHDFEMIINKSSPK